MTEYYEHGLSLNNNQITKIVKAANNHSSTTIRLSKNDLHGNHKLPLTKTQINRINKSKTGLNLTLSYAQIKHINSFISGLQKKGGIIPLLSLIPIIAGALGAAGGVAGGVSKIVSTVNNAKAAAAAQSELERHNREVESQLKSGSAISDYAGSYLKPLLQKLGLGINDYNKIINGDCVGFGKGLYLRPYGAGLYLGP